MTALHLLAWIMAGAGAVLALTALVVAILCRWMVPEGRARLADPAQRRPSRADVPAVPPRALPAGTRRAIEAPRDKPSGGAR
jgi:hypothetical protein